MLTKHQNLPLTALYPLGRPSTLTAHISLSYSYR